MCKVTPEELIHDLTAYKKAKGGLEKWNQLFLKKSSEDFAEGNQCEDGSLRFSNFAKCEK
jgi:hypothetical protein